MADQANEGLLSPFLKRRRIAAAAPFLRGQVLDIGCGSGALAELIESSNYLGVDRDPISLDKAKKSFPSHQFQTEMPATTSEFDTVVALAVIEHVPDPSRFLTDLAGFLPKKGFGQIICTTPHPAFDWVHDAGSVLGLFSKHASDEHEALLGFGSLKSAARASGLKLDTYKKFLFGANQLAIFKTDN